MGDRTILAAGDCPAVGIDHNGCEIECEKPLGHSGNHSGSVVYEWFDEDEDPDEWFDEGEDPGADPGREGS